MNTFRYEFRDPITKVKGINSDIHSDWLLGDLSSLIYAGKERANDQLGKLSSPQRQLYYLAGLNISSDPGSGRDIMYEPKNDVQHTKKTQPKQYSNIRIAKTCEHCQKKDTSVVLSERI